MTVLRPKTRKANAATEAEGTVDREEGKAVGDSRQAEHHPTYPLVSFHRDR
jgi:hypothetical protein